MIRKKDLLIEHPIILENFYKREFKDLPFPLTGFHTVEEWKGTVQYGYTGIVSHLIGGASNGVDITIVMIYTEHRDDPTYYGYRYGFGFPCYSVDNIAVQNVLSRIRRDARIRSLIPIWEVPKFQEGDGEDWKVYHEDGWYTRSIFARVLPSPDIIERSSVYLLKEGVYISFYDGTYRLVPHRDYFNFINQYYSYPDYRQGDLLIYKASQVHIEEYHDIQDGLEIDSHKIKTKVYRNDDRYFFHVDENPVIISHPEHEDITIDEPGVYEIVMLPGTSRPFQNCID